MGRGSSSSNCASQRASLVAKEGAMYSTSVDDDAIAVCLLHSISGHIYLLAKEVQYFDYAKESFEVDLEIKMMRKRSC